MSNARGYQMSISSLVWYGNIYINLEYFAVSLIKFITVFFYFFSVDHILFLDLLQRFQILRKYLLLLLLRRPGP